MTSRMRAFRKPLLVLALLACLAIALIDQPASAHANLLKASPKPSEELNTPPERVIIWFTEPIEPAFSSISVLNPLGATVTSGDTEFDPTEPTAMWVPLGPLDNGTYTVVWRNVSTVDGHKVAGSFLFAVGEPLGAGPQVDIAEQPLIQSPLDPVIRWIIYIGIATFAGGLLFELLIATRVARDEDDRSALLFTQIVSLGFAFIAIASLAFVFLAQLAQLALQTSIAFDVPIHAIGPGQLIDVATESDWGRYWSWRISAVILAGLALVATIQLRRDDPYTKEPEELENMSLITETPMGIGAIAFGGIYLLLITLTSHNAATPSDIRWFAIATDLIHIIAATIWVGGIAYLLTAYVISARLPDVHSPSVLLKFASRFAPLAIFATTVLVASGIVSSLMQVTIPEALNTPYGRVLGAKILLLIILIALAIRNNRSVAKSSSADKTTADTLRRFVAIELSVAFAVLLATAGLASLEPARLYAERKGIGVDDYVTVKETIAGATIEAKLEPGNIGSNNLTVDITDDGAPFLSATEVRARVRYLDDEFGEYFTPLLERSLGNWSLNDINISVAGAYQLDVTVVRSDSFDSHLSTRFSARSDALAADLIRPSIQTVMTAFGVLIAVAGLAYLVASTITTKPVTFKFRPHQGIAFVAFTIGIFAIVNAYTFGIGIPDEAKGNPFPLTQESVQLGQATYATTCTTCHGDTGKGDGPAGLLLNPPPADLAIHVPLHTDNELYDFIANGIDGTPMVAQRDTLTPDQIWHLVNYIRTISE